MAEAANRASPTDVIEDDVDLDMSDSIDEVSAEQLKHDAQEAVGEGHRTLSEIYESLTPAKRAAFFATVQLGKSSSFYEKSWHYIDRKAAPSHLDFYWFAPFVVATLDMRGWRRVKRTKATMRWTPNMRHANSSKYIEAPNGYFLVAIEKDELLRRRALEEQEKNAHVENLNQLGDGLVSGHKELGLTKSEAAEIQRIAGGIYATRGLDPDYDISGDRPDLIEHGESEQR